MSKRYIDVDKFAEAICNFQQIDEDAANAMIWLLRTFPTADVVEVRHGMWIKHKEHCLEYRCSFCEYEHCRKVNYCPNCGAKMDSERSENGT